MRTKLKQLLHFHWVLTMLLMCISVFIFSASSFNIFFLLKANIELVLEYGSIALIDGALMQILELLGLSLVSASFYVIFKACERILLEKLLD